MNCWMNVESPSRIKRKEKGKNRARPNTKLWRVCVCACVCVCVCVCACVWGMYTHIYTHVCASAHTHAHAHSVSDPLGRPRFTKSPTTLLISPSKGNANKGICTNETEKLTRLTSAYHGAATLIQYYALIMATTVLPLWGLYPFQCEAVATQYFVLQSGSKMPWLLAMCSLYMSRR